MKVRVLWPGKTKQSYFRDAVKDYSSRIARFIPFEIIETKEYSAADRNKSQRISKESKSLLNAAKDSVRVVLDTDGKQLTSEEFAAWRFARKLFWFLLPFAIGLHLATVYLRHHYVVDLLAGWVLGILAYRYAPVWEQTWEKLRQRLKSKYYKHSML